MINYCQPVFIECPVRGPGLRIRRVAGRRRPGERARCRRRRRQMVPAGSGPARALRTDVLVRENRDLCPRARRRKTALSRPDLQRRTVSLHRHCQPRESWATSPRAAWRRLLLWLGRAHGGRIRAALQPDVDLLLLRHDQDVEVSVLRREGDVRVLVAK